MERIFAAIDDGVITNTFVGDEAFADLVRPDHDDVVEITDLDPCPGIAWTVHPDGYRPPSPYPSWLWQDGAWVAPTPCPTEGSWRWDEDSLSWVDATPVGE